MIRRAASLSLALFLSVVFAAPALAGTYDGGTGSAEVLADGSIRVTGEGCPPDADISYTVTRDGAAAGQGTAQADADGAFDFVVETEGAGDYQVTVECGGETIVLNATVSAGAAAGEEAAGDLPTTGSDSSLPLAQLGAVLVAGGAVAVYVARRRKSSAFTS